MKQKHKNNVCTYNTREFIQLCLKEGCELIFISVTFRSWPLRKYVSGDHSFKSSERRSLSRGYLITKEVFLKFKQKSDLIISKEAGTVQKPQRCLGIVYVPPRKNPKNQR